MSARYGHVHYSYDICNETSHNRETCSNRQYMYEKTNIYYDISWYFYKAY